MHETACLLSYFPEQEDGISLNLSPGQHVWAGAAVAKAPTVKNVMQLKKHSKSRWRQNNRKQNSTKQTPHCPQQRGRPSRDPQCYMAVDPARQGLPKCKSDSQISKGLFPSIASAMTVCWALQIGAVLYVQESSENQTRGADQLPRALPPQSCQSARAWRAPNPLS